MEVPSHVSGKLYLINLINDVVAMVHVWPTIMVNVHDLYFNK